MTVTTNPPLANRDASTDAVVFFEDTYRSFLAAEQAEGAFELSLRIGQHTVCLRFAGTACVEILTRAVRHLQTDNLADKPGLTICIWQDNGLEMRLPSLPSGGTLITRQGDVGGYNTSRILAALDRATATLSLLDRERSLALYCARDARQLPAYEGAAPLKTILYWWLREQGTYLVHAAAIGTAKGGVLLAGKGGSGKSTTALAALISDLTYVSDDYCLVTAESGWTAQNLYNSAKLTPASLDLLPQLLPLAELSNLRFNDKRILFLDTAFPDKLARALPLKAIVLPRLTGRAQPRLLPATSNAALSALAISTLVQLPGARDETLRAMETLTHDLPCFVLELGNPHAVPPLLRNLIDTLSDSPVGAPTA